jgi:hypothetical protein
VRLSDVAEHNCPKIHRYEKRRVFENVEKSGFLIKYELCAQT